MEDAMTMNG